MGKQDLKDSFKDALGNFFAGDYSKGYLWIDSKQLWGTQSLENCFLEYIRLLKKGVAGDEDGWNWNSIKETKSEIVIFEKKLRTLDKFIEDYVRLAERYKFDKNTLRRIQEDWKDYNRWACSVALKFSQFLRSPSEKHVQGFASAFADGKIMSEEIERRFKKLLISIRD